MTRNTSRTAPSVTTPQGSSAPPADSLPPDPDDNEPEPDEGERFMRGVLIGMAVTFVLGVVGIVITIRLG